MGRLHLASRRTHLGMLDKGLHRPRVCHSCFFLWATWVRKMKMSLEGVLRGVLVRVWKGACSSLHPFAMADLGVFTVLDTMPFLVVDEKINVVSCSGDIMASFPSRKHLEAERTRPVGYFMISFLGLAEIKTDFTRLLHGFAVCLGAALVAMFLAVRSGAIAGGEVGMGAFGVAAVEDDTRIHC